MSRRKEDLKVNERNYVEIPLLEQLKSLGWEIIDLERTQEAKDSYRNSFGDPVMHTVLQEQIAVINPWLEPDQVEAVANQLTTGFPGTDILNNNELVHTKLLEGSSVSENRQTGEINPTVRYIDFKTVTNNRFIAVCQLKLRITGAEGHIFPDIICYVNGLPFVIIECKSPKAKDSIAEAINQMMRYGEQRGERGEGNRALFYYNQFLVATDRTYAKFGTFTTHSEKKYYRWADPYPLTLNDLPRGASTPDDQHRLVAGMLSHQNLLDLLRTYTLFTENDKGQKIKIVARYQQFRAVKLAVKRLLDGKTPRERSGIVWHTQGSGKSLTMMFMVRAMYQHPMLAEWKIIFITDRTQLEKQLNTTGQGVGYTIKVANSIRKLRELVGSDSSDLVMAMIHKFQESGLKQLFPELNSSPNILIMTDEAHRSQYKLLGANLDKAVPNAARIGYTGTPIDKTEVVFGDYIDKYTMRQSIEDGITLEIVYEGRTVEAEVVDRAEMDKKFVDVFSDYNIKERLAILGYATRDAYLVAQPVIDDKAKDMVQHYIDHVFPNGFKAQIVATSREAAVRYKTAVDKALVAAKTDWEANKPNHKLIDQMRDLECGVVISGGHNDKPHIKKHTNSTDHESIIKSFKMPFDASSDEGIQGNVGIVIVTNMLLTGFDAPHEQVMYLDRVITNHNLLQAIARVNRVGPANKEKGFIIDYVGVGHKLKRAIDNYDEREQKEILNTLSFPEKELRELEAIHKEIMRLLESYDIEDFTDFEAFFDLFYDEEIRYEYVLIFKRFSSALNVVYPSRHALKFVKDYQLLNEINVKAGQHFQDERVSMTGIPAKLQPITDEHLESKGISQVIKPISILDEEFQQGVGKLKRAKNRAAAVEHAIRNFIDTDLDDDPDLQASFAEMLEKILESFSDNWDQIYIELEKLRQKMRDADKEPTYGLDKKRQMPFFRTLKLNLFGAGQLTEDQIAQLVDLTQRVTLQLERELTLAGFWNSKPAQARLKASLHALLLSAEFASLPNMIKNYKKILSSLMEKAEKNQDVFV